MTALALVLGLAAAPEPHCYLVLFGGQSNRVRPDTAHTWATFVKSDGGVCESFTISWLPVRMPVRPLKLIPEAGRNYGLHETVALFTTGNHKVGVWGPFEIQPYWYAEACQHKAVLDSGAVDFLTLDRGPLRKNAPLRRPDISHCVHAITRTNEDLQHATRPIFTAGELVTRKLAERMNDVGLLIQPCVKHDWVFGVIDLHPETFTRRDIGEPALSVLR